MTGRSDGRDAGVVGGLNANININGNAIQATTATAMVTAADTSKASWSGLLDGSIQSARLQLISDIAVVSVDRALSLSHSLDISKVKSFVECFRVLWCTGKERKALELFHNADDDTKREVAAPLVSLACEQVDVVLDAMRKDKRYRTLLSTVPANIYKSVRSAARKAKKMRSESGRKDSKRMQKQKVSPSLSETHRLLSRLVPVCSKNEPAHEIAVNVAGVVSTLARRVTQLREQRDVRERKERENNMT
jgi:hypothetical protein